MSVDTYATLVLGAPIDEVATAEDCEAEVTRYDEETGKPRQKRVPMTAFTLTDGTRHLCAGRGFGWFGFVADRLGADADEVTAGSPGKLGLVADTDAAFALGLVIAQVGSYGEPLIGEVPAVRPDQEHEVREWFRRYFAYEGPVRLLLVLETHY